MKNFVEIVVPPLAQQFTYQVPSGLEVEIGYKVWVPFGQRKAEGFVVANRTKPQAEIKDRLGKEIHIKEILARSATHPCFSTDQLNLFRWVAEYYGSSLSSVIDVAVPPLSPQRFTHTVSLLTTELNIELKGKLQNEIFNFVLQQGGSVPLSELRKRFKSPSIALKRLTELKLIEISSEESLDHHLKDATAPSWAKRDVELNNEQQKAVKLAVHAASSGEFKSFLLHGLTGSGKTEVYIEAAREVLAQGKGVLVIVPEIALTPALLDRFRARVGSGIATLHSALNRRSRWDSWRALIEKRSFIAIGARSAVFAPVENLGLIIVDEEHDHSFKQSDGLRYNARDIAVVRAKNASCPVILGSATPSLESFYHAITKKYHYLSLPHRHSAQRLAIEIVDLNVVKPWEMPSKNIAPRLLELLRNTIDRGEQAFILYNRRGFASYLQCEKCEEVIGCKNCSVTMTYHQNKNALICHYCGASQVAPSYCQACAERFSAARKNNDSPKQKDDIPGTLALRGAGTERVFDELKMLFPETAIDRLDRDAADDPAKFRAIIERVRSGETRILVGTQMIAKGHDLPGVTLVGVIDCDVGLHMPDFRASERIFELLTQAAGRAGRGEKAGSVILQTRVPKHLSLQKTLEQDFTGFAKLELGSRKEANYPPFTKLLRVVASSAEKEPAQVALIELRDALIVNPYIDKKELVLLGPAPAPLARIKAAWRWHMLFKSKSAAKLNQLIRFFREHKLRVKKVELVFDMDPQDML